MKKKILIVDDEADIVRMLQRFFEGKEYEVLTALDGIGAVKQAEKQPDLILLDINMPKMDGFQVCQRIRDYVNCPILFLTARVEDQDKVRGFASGGDDYAVKPFSMVELEARVEAHLRRQQRGESKTRVKFAGELSIDYGQRKVFYQGKPIEFAKKDYEILELLSQNPKQVFDKERIYERIWDYDSEGQASVVAEHIRRIRSTFLAAGCESYIETVWGCGYRWKE